MNRRLAATVLAGSAFGVSAAMSVVIAFVPFLYQRVDALVEGSGEIAETYRASAIDVNGWWVAPLIFVHSAAALYFFVVVSGWARRGGVSTIVLYSFPAALFMYSLATVTTWGFYLAPSGALALAAAMVLPKDDPVPISRTVVASPETRRGRGGGRRRRRR